jgi:hypothetical protein
LRCVVRNVFDRPAVEHALRVAGSGSRAEQTQSGCGVVINNALPVIQHFSHSHLRFRITTIRSKANKIKCSRETCGIAFFKDARACFEGAKG